MPAAGVAFADHHIAESVSSAGCRASQWFQIDRAHSRLDLHSIGTVELSLRRAPEVTFWRAPCNRVLGHQHPGAQPLSKIVKDARGRAGERLARGNAPQVMATLRNTAISLVRLAGATNIAASLRHHAARAERPITLLLTS